MAIDPIDAVITEAVVTMSLVCNLPLNDNNRSKPKLVQRSPERRARYRFPVGSATRTIPTCASLQRCKGHTSVSPGSRNRVKRHRARTREPIFNDRPSLSRAPFFFFFFFFAVVLFFFFFFFANVRSFAGGKAESFTTPSESLKYL